MAPTKGCPSAHRPSIKLKSDFFEDLQLQHRLRRQTTFDRMARMAHMYFLVDVLIASCYY